MHAKLNEGSIKGAAFDLDGLLVDSQTPIHALAESQILAARGIIVKPEEISKRFAGISTKQVFKELAPHLDPEVLYQEKWKKVREIIEKDSVKPIPGLYEVLEFFKERGISMCIASASPRWYIEMMLKHSINRKGSDKHLLEEYFGTNYVSAEEVAHPKPAPDVFLRAAQIMKVDPKRCIVLGDGHSDVRGGLAAEMRVVFLNEDYETFIGQCGVHICSDGYEIYEYVKNFLANRYS